MPKNHLSEKETYEALGYLAHPYVAMHYDIQVPYKKRDEFEAKYQELTGEECCKPGKGSMGYAVLGRHVDKYGVQHRFSYLPVGLVPPSLDKLSVNTKTARKRISCKPLVQKMLENGFVLGSRPLRSRIISKIDSAHHIRFEFGYTAASVKDETMKFQHFRSGFSSIVDTPTGKFSLFDKKSETTIVSRKIGRSAAFRYHVLGAYDNQCCVCSGSLVDLSGMYETEAAHIVPKKLHGSDDVRNGLALCRKHHWAYDRGLFGIDGDYSVIVPKSVAAVPVNNTLASYHGSHIKTPKSAPSPALTALEWHRKHILSDNF